MLAPSARAFYHFWSYIPEVHFPPTHFSSQPKPIRISKTLENQNSQRTKILALSKTVFGMVKNFINRLPGDIIFDILTRLPTESVLECKLVCKSWRTLICHPSFPQMHLTRLDHPSDSGKLGYIYFNMWNHEDNRLYYFEYSENWIHHETKPIDRMTMFSLTTTYESYIVLGSINGLICIYGCKNEDPYGPACICNPITKEYVILPEYLMYVEACGFGYLPSTNEYKVVKIYESGNFVEVEVYTVGSGNGWREVGKFNFTFRTLCDKVGVFANGALHWRNHVDSGKVVVFDLADEKFREHLTPPPMLPDSDSDDEFVLGVSNGILFYAVGQTNEEGEDLSDVWLLNKKQQGEHLSLGWCKEFDLSQREPFTFTNYGKALFYDQGCLKYDPTDSTPNRCAMFMTVSDISHQVFPHKHTLISLKQLGEDGTEIMKTREI